MGKGKGPAPLKINVKKLEYKGLECFEEMSAMFACMSKVGLTNFDDGCKAERMAISECAELMAKRGKRRSSINFHLQRLSRALRR